MVTDEIPETELNGEMFCYKRKKNLHGEQKKNGNMKCFYVTCDLLYDPKGQGDLYGLFDLVYDPKRSRGH